MSLQGVAARALFRPGRAALTRRKVGRHFTPSSALLNAAMRSRLKCSHNAGQEIFGVVERFGDLYPLTFWLLYMSPCPHHSSNLSNAKRRYRGVRWQEFNYHFVVVLLRDTFDHHL